jgi:HSP20 family molecular chaperone IbpA
MNPPRYALDAPSGSLGGIISFFHKIALAWPSKSPIDFEIAESPERYMAYAELPGFHPWQIQARLTADGLSVSIIAGVPDAIVAGRMGGFHASDSIDIAPALRASGVFRTPIDPARAFGTLHNGLLVLTLPKLYPHESAATAIPIRLFPGELAWGPNASSPP